MTVEVTSFLAKLIDAIENVRLFESERWSESEHFLKLESCLEDAHELLHFELTQSSTSTTPENKPQTISRRVTRQSTAKRIKAKRISLPDEVLNIIFGYFKDTFDFPTYLSSNAYNFCLVSKSWHRVANRRLWQNVHLLSENSTILFARSLYERHHSATLLKGSPLSISDSIRGLHVHECAEMSFSASITYVLGCVNRYTRNLVSLNLKGLSTYDRPLKLKQFYEIIKFHPFLKHVWLDVIDFDSAEPLHPLPQLETCDCTIWWGPDDVETLELISAKTISIASINVFIKDAVKSVYSGFWHLFRHQAHEFQQLTHLHMSDFFDDSVKEDNLLEGFSRIVKLPHLSFLVLESFTYLSDGCFALIAEHCSLTAFVINWQPSGIIVDSWCALIRKLGPNLLSIGVGLEGDMYLDHPNIFQAIYQNCPNLMTLELYGHNIPNDAWPLQYTSELENLCHLPLKWIYAPWFQDWPHHWRDRCPKFAKLSRLGLDVGLDDFPEGSTRLLDYNQSIRPAIFGVEGFYS